MPRSFRLSLAFLLFAVASRAGAQGSLIILNKGEATASIVSLSDGRTTATMPVGDGPHEVAVSRDGRWAIAANYGGTTPGNSLTLLDLRTRQAVKTISTGEYRRPHGIAWLPDGKRVVVTSEVGKAVLIVDAASGTIVKAIPTNVDGTHLLVLSKDGTRVWTSNIFSGTNSLIDLAKGELLKTATNGKGPEAIDISPDGKELWTADRPLNRITVLNATTLDSIAESLLERETLDTADLRLLIAGQPLPPLPLPKAGEPASPEPRREAKIEAVPKFTGKKLPDPEPIPG